MVDEGTGTRNGEEGNTERNTIPETSCVSWASSLRGTVPGVARSGLITFFFSAVPGGPSNNRGTVQCGGNRISSPTLG